MCVSIKMKFSSGCSAAFCSNSSQVMLFSPWGLWGGATSSSLFNDGCSDLTEVGDSGGGVDPMAAFFGVVEPKTFFNIVCFLLPLPLDVPGIFSPSLDDVDE